MTTNAVSARRIFWATDGDGNDVESGYAYERGVIVSHGCDWAQCPHADCVMVRFSDGVTLSCAVDALRPWVDEYKVIKVGPRVRRKGTWDNYVKAYRYDHYRMVTLSADGIELAPCEVITTEDDDKITVGQYAIARAYRRQSASDSYVVPS